MNILVVAFIAYSNRPFGLSKVADIDMNFFKASALCLNFFLIEILVL